MLGPSINDVTHLGGRGNLQKGEVSPYAYLVKRVTMGREGYVIYRWPLTSSFMNSEGKPGHWSWKKDTQVPGFVLGHRQIIMPQNQLQIMKNRKHIVPYPDFEATKSNPVFNVKTPDFVGYPSSHHRGLVLYQLGFLASKPRYSSFIFF